MFGGVIGVGVFLYVCKDVFVDVLVVKFDGTQVRIGDWGWGGYALFGYAQTA